MDSSSEQAPLIQSTNNGVGDGIADRIISNREPNQTKIAVSTSYQNSNVQSTSNANPSDSRNAGFTNMTIIALAFTVFVQSYLLEGVFPYAGFLTLHLLSSENKDGIAENINEETVGKYTGYIAFSFMAGRTVTAVLWGKLADIYGRTFVLKVSLVASAITSLGFGFASTYEEALFWRFLMGVGNGITGAIKCLLSEINEPSRYQARETKIMAIVYGMRGYGFLLCPAITGYLSDPLQQYPKTMASVKIPERIISLLSAYPFVLPNLLAFFLCLSAYQFVRDNVAETLPEEKIQRISLFPASVKTLCLRPWSLEGTGNDKNEASNSPASDLLIPKGGCNNIEIRGDEKIDGEASSSGAPAITTKHLLWGSGSTRTQNSDIQLQQQRQIRGRWYHLYIYWMFSFLSIAADELFPLFCLSKLSGLSLQENQISFILCGTTIVYGVLQYVLLTGLVQKIGLYPTLRIGVFGSIPTTILIPVGSLWWVAANQRFGNSRVDGSFVDVDDSPNSQKLDIFLVLYLCTIIAVIKSFTSILFSTITMATNRTVETIDQRATLNGIATLGGSIAKACGPVFAGTLFSFLAGNTGKNTRSVTSGLEAPEVYSGFYHHGIQPPYGSIVAYGIISMLGLILGIQTLVLRSNPSSSSPLA